MRSKLSQLLAASAVLALTAGSASAVTIYQDDFSGGTGDINGTTPDTTTGGATWVAAPIMDANGNVNQTDVTASGAGSATLAFTPVNGLVYTLEVGLGDITTEPTASDNNDDESWIGVGFGAGQSMDEANSNRFISDNLIGKAWTFNRGSGASGNFPNQAFLGDSAAAGTNKGLADGESWTSDGTTFGGNMDLRIVLDTTGGTGTWTATWFADTGSGFTEVRATTQLLDETIDSVGYAVSSLNATGTVESFSLTSVPEPGSLALLGLGGLLIARRRRNA